MSTPAALQRGAVTAGTAPLAEAQSPQARLYRRWRALAPRERSALRAVLGLLGALVVWLAAVQPAWRTLRTAPAQLAQVESHLQQMRRLADEARGLRGAVPVSAAQAAAALRAATERLGNGARISIQGDRATLTLPPPGVGPAAPAGGFSGAAPGFRGAAGGGPAFNATGGGANTDGGNPSGAAGGIGPAAAGGAPLPAGAPSSIAGGMAGGVSGDALRGWLAEARSAARARPVDLQLTRVGSHFTGSVVVLIGTGSGSGTGGSP